jgi:hypothetical protein
MSLSLLSTEPHNLVIWASKSCRQRLTILSPEFLSTVAKTSHFYHLSLWVKSLEAHNPLTWMFHSVAKGSQSYLLSPSTLTWSSQSYHLSFSPATRSSQCYHLTSSVLSPEAHKPVSQCRHLSLTPVWVGSCAAHRLCRSRLPRFRSASPYHPTVKTTWGDLRNPRVRLQQKSEAL